MQAEKTLPFSHVLLMFTAAAVTLVGAVLIVQVNRQYVRAAAFYEPPPKAPLPSLGVLATLRCGSNSIERTWLTLDFTLESGKLIDEALPAGPLEGEFVVTFKPGSVQYAQIGAILQGGSVIIMHGDEVLLSDYAPATAEKTVLARLPVWLPMKHEQIKYIFKSDHAGTTRLTAVWQPEGATEPAPLPAATTGAVPAAPKN